MAQIGRLAAPQKPEHPQTAVKSQNLSAKQNKTSGQLMSIVHSAPPYFWGETHIEGSFAIVQSILCAIKFH